jgi:5-methylcytosine-specific restriction protein A
MDGGDEDELPQGRADRIEHLTADGRALTGRPGSKRHRYFLIDGTPWRGEVITLAPSDAGWRTVIGVWVKGGGWTVKHRWPTKPSCTPHPTRAEALACAEQQLPEHRRYAATEATSVLSYRREAQRRRAGRRSSRVGPGWQRARHQVLNEEPRCRRCGDQATEVDHIVPTFRGGSSERDNLQALCTSCHQAKTTTEQPLRPNGQSLP